MRPYRREPLGRGNAGPGTSFVGRHWLAAQNTQLLCLGRVRHDRGLAHRQVWCGDRLLDGGQATASRARRGRQHEREFTPAGRRVGRGLSETVKVSESTSELGLSFDGSKLIDGLKWTYPSSRELYQLLDKGARLQLARPDVDIVPIFICRRPHITTMRMAKDLGFFVIPTRRQYIAPTIEETRIAEIRAELGLLDLVGTHDADERIIAFLVKHLPKVLDRSVRSWKESATELSGYFSALRQEAIAVRSQLLIQMRERVRAAWGLDFGLGW